MGRVLFFGVVIGAMLFGMGVGFAANDESQAVSESAPDFGPFLPSARNLANAPYLSPSGRTVPRPGAAPNSGEARPERMLHEKDDRLILRSICSNC
jgi:hypothetical protein